MKHVLVIGIGAGNPDYVTIQAINAMNKADVFFVADKGADKSDLNALRREICDRFITGKNYRMVEFPSPPRDTSADVYRDGIDATNDRLTEAYEKLLREELEDGETAGFLVWGDPSLYDSTLRILAHIQSKGELAFNYEVIPGISSIQALAARHKVALNRIGEPVEITTGRRLAEGKVNATGSTVIMLDSREAFKTVSPDTDIYWGAYLGTPDEILVSGKVGDVAGKIEKLRAAARQAKGWIMDTYLLKKGD